MAIYISPEGNPEVWAEKPAGYFTPEQWAATHPVPESKPDPDAERLARLTEIKTELAAIDLASIRPLRAVDNGSDSIGDHQRLIELERKAAALRAEMEKLNG